MYYQTLFDDPVSGNRCMRRFLVSLIIVFLLFSSHSAEASFISAIIKIFKKAADNVDGESIFNFFVWGSHGAKKVIEIKRDRDEEEKRKERTLSEDTQTKLGGKIDRRKLGKVSASRIRRDSIKSRKRMERLNDLPQQEKTKKERALFRNLQGSPRQTETFKGVQTKPENIIGEEKTGGTMSQPKNRDKYLLFFNQRSAREAVKCKDGDPKMVTGYGASIYQRPDLASSILGKYEPNERICVEGKILGWRKTPFGWLEGKNIF